jgi:hypothetical protein
LGLHRFLSSGKWTPSPWKLKVKARSQQLIVPCNFKICYLGYGTAVRLLVTNYIEERSSWAADSHLLHQETPCLIIEKADLVLNLPKPVTCHSSESNAQPSVLFLWKGKFVPVYHEGICGEWCYHCTHF